jgi:K+-sensing histidine kinase KdpD
MQSPKDILSKVKGNALFAGVDIDSLSELILDGISERNVHAGELIFEEDTSEGVLYLLIKGRVQIDKHTKAGEELSLALLHSGDFFGELEMLDGRPRSARAVALDDTSLVGITKSSLEIMIANSHAITLNLLRTLSLRLRTIDIAFVREHERTTVELRKQVEQLEHLSEAAKILNSTLDLDQLLTLNLETALRLINADRGTLYLVDDVKKELWSKVLKASEVVEIRLPLGHGIAGHIALTGEIYNNSDVYNDNKFDALIDQKTGYRTKSMLCVPVKDKYGKIVAVFQLLNKVGGNFTKRDEQFVQALCTHIAIAITNAQVAQQMVNSERLAAVGKMAATIVHDIKNPLTTLRLNAELLKRNVGNEELAKQAEEIIAQVDRFVSMAQEILEFSRGISQLNIQETDFEELMSGLIQFIRRGFEKKDIRILEKILYKGRLFIDADKILRVFYNIAGNAADAMQKGGILTIYAIQVDSFVLIEFSDTGIGMPPEVKEKMFEPFVTFGKKVGTGLGMAITKKIVDDHKGRIEVDSTLGKGTTIRIYLPLSQQQ